MLEHASPKTRGASTIITKGTWKKCLNNSENIEKAVANDRGFR